MVGCSTNFPEWLVLQTKTGKVHKAYSVQFMEREAEFAPSHVPLEYSDGESWTNKTDNVVTENESKNVESETIDMHVGEPESFSPENLDGLPK